MLTYFVSFGLKYQDYNFKRKPLITNDKHHDDLVPNQQENITNKETVIKKEEITKEDSVEKIEDQPVEKDTKDTNNPNFVDSSILDNALEDFQKKDLLEVKDSNEESVSDNSNNKQDNQEGDKNNKEQLDEIVKNKTISIMEKISLIAKIKNVSTAIIISTVYDKFQLINIEGQGFLYLCCSSKSSEDMNNILRNYENFNGNTYNEFILWLKGLTKQTLINLTFDTLLLKFGFGENKTIGSMINGSFFDQVLSDIALYRNKKIKPLSQMQQIEFEKELLNFISKNYSSFQTDLDYLSSIETKDVPYDVNCLDLRNKQKDLFNENIGLFSNPKDQQNESILNFYFSFLENLNIFRDISDKFSEFKLGKINIEIELNNNIKDKSDLIKVSLVQNKEIDDQNFLFFGITKSKTPIVLTKKDIINIEKKYTFIGNECFFKMGQFTNPHFESSIETKDLIIKTKTFYHSLVKYFNNKINSSYFKNPDSELTKIKLIWEIDKTQMYLKGIKIDNVIIPIYNETKFKLSYLLYGYLINYFTTLNFRLLDILDKIIAEECLTTDVKTRKLELPKYSKLEITKLEKTVTQKLDQYFKFKKITNSKQTAIFLNSINEIFTAERKKKPAERKKAVKTDLQTKLNNTNNKLPVFRDFFYIQSEKGNFYFGLNSNNESKSPYNDFCVLNDDFINKYWNYELKLNKIQLNGKDYSYWILQNDKIINFYDVLSEYLLKILSNEEVVSLNFNFTKQKNLNILNGFNALIKYKKEVLKNINLRLSIVLCSFLMEMKIDLENSQIKKLLTIILEIENQQRPETLMLENLAETAISVINNLKNR